MWYKKQNNTSGNSQVLRPIGWSDMFFMAHWHEILEEPTLDGNQNFLLATGGNLCWSPWVGKHRNSASRRGSSQVYQSTVDVSAFAQKFVRFKIHSKLIKLSCFLRRPRALSFWKVLNSWWTSPRVRSHNGAQLLHWSDTASYWINIYIYTHLLLY